MFPCFTGRLGCAIARNTRFRLTPTALTAELVTSPQVAFVYPPEEWIITSRGGFRLPG